MHAPLYIQKELALINSDYFMVFDPLENPPDGEGFWKVRRWLFKNPINRQMYSWQYNSTPVLTVCDVDMRTGIKHYVPLSSGVIKALKEGLWGARNAKHLLQKADANNEKTEWQRQEEYRYQLRYIAKQMYRHFREPRVFLGG